MSGKLSPWKIILGLVALLALTVAGLHFHVTRQVERELMSIASHASPLGTLEWGAVWLHPSGQIRINELQFAPHLVAGETRIGQLTITAPNLIELLQATREFDQGRIPPSLGLQIRELRIPIDVTTVNQLDTAFSSGLPFETAGCNERNTLRLSDLPDLDIWNLVSDINLDYRIIDNGEAAQIRLSSHSQNLAGMSMDLRIYLGSSSRNLRLLTRAGASARLERAAIDYRNLGFRERVERFCADQLGISIDHFKNVHVNAWSAGWAHLGLSPSEELLDAYRQFIADPQIINLVVYPRQRLPLTAFAQLELMELIDFMEVTVSVNDDREIGVNFDTVAAVPLPSVVEEEQGEAAEPAEPAGVRRISWTEIPATQAEHHVSGRVRITTNTGDRISGELVEVEANYLHLRIRGAGGFYIRPFSRSGIAAVEVRQ